MRWEGPVRGVCLCEGLSVTELYNLGFFLVRHPISSSFIIIICHFPNLLSFFIIVSAFATSNAHVPYHFEPPTEFVIDGYSLTPRALVMLSYGLTKLTICPEAMDRVRASRRVGDGILARGETKYGINTGFGKFSSVLIDADKLVELQENLIRSHCAGVGYPLSPNRVRMLMLHRLNVLVRGNSGVSEETVLQFVHAFNNHCLPYIPEKGTVGASGDLAPLSHLALGLMGEGRMWNGTGDGRNENDWVEASAVLASKSLKPIKLKAKEGLALINGTQLITSLTCEALFRGQNMLKSACIIASLTNDALLGTPDAYHSLIQEVRPHRGQKRTAALMRACLDREGNRSPLRESHHNCSNVQDAYSLRCVPQVHGIVEDMLNFVEGILQTELNSSLDNPMVFADHDGLIISGGNFHGEYPAKAADMLAIALSELASLSERRQERLMNPDLSEGLPAFLCDQPGLESGFMIAHCTSAALVCENRTLSMPASVESLPTSAAKEDHVSMGGMAARKALTVAEHVEQCLAIECLAASQAIALRKLQTTPILEKSLHAFREYAPVRVGDAEMSTSIAAAHKGILENCLWRAAKTEIEAYLQTQKLE